jgi:hypothetical protein
MKTIAKLAMLALALSAATCHAAEGGEVLWWTIGTDYESISGKSVVDGTVYTAGELKVTDARIRYESTVDGSTGYLTMLGLNDDGTVSVYDGSAGLGGEFGMGVPAEYFGSLGALSGTSYNFVLELGNYSNGKWVHTSMESEKISYAELLADNHISAWDNKLPVDGSPWSPSTYVVVPEPANGLLLLVGGAMLMLRRKRKQG